jgi:hypothetical protein
LDYCPDDVQDRGDCIRVPFDKEEQGQTGGVRRPRVANVQELKVAYCNYLKEEKPERLECKVEKALKDRGHLVLWTPPYCPDLQPIELFWAAGKNHAGFHHENDRKMKECIKHLREGWWGNGYGEDGKQPDDPEYKAPVDCNKLFNTAIKHANNKFIPLCPGISGTIGNLTVDPDYQDEGVDFPIDAFVIDLTKDADEGDLIDDDALAA